MLQYICAINGTQPAKFSACVNDDSYLKSFNAIVIKIADEDDDQQIKRQIEKSDKILGDLIYLFQPFLDFFHLVVVQKLGDFVCFKIA